MIAHVLRGELKRRIEVIPANIVGVVMPAARAGADHSDSSDLGGADGRGSLRGDNAPIARSVRRTAPASSQAHQCRGRAVGLPGWGGTARCHNRSVRDLLDSSTSCRVPVVS